MRELAALIKIIQRIETKKIKILGKNTLTKGEKITQLYRGIAADKWSSDKEAAIAIYGENYKSSSYTSLKNSLSSRLLNSLFFITLSDFQFNNFQKEYLESEKLRAVIKILAGIGAKSLSVKLAEKLINKSLKYKFTEINLELAKLLRRHYRLYQANPKKAAYYDEIVNHQLVILIAETEIEDWYEQLVQKIGNKRNVQQSLVQQGKQISDKVKSIFPRLQSNKLALFANLIFVLEHELAKDYVSVEHACKTAVAYYEKELKFSSSGKKLIFQIKLVSVYLSQKNFEEGESITQAIITSITKGSINWFITLDHYFLLCFHTGNYEKGVQVFETAISHPSYSTLSPYYKEMWLIYDAYIEYLKEVGLLKVKIQKKFRTARFLNTVPVFSKDKTGINISILIIHCLLLMIQGKKSKLIERAETLQTYTYKYLKNDDSLRSNCFIRMFLKMVAAGFRKEGTINRTKKLFDKLKSTPIFEKRQSNYVEIIPYEKLWEICLKQLS